MSGINETIIDVSEWNFFDEADRKSWDFSALESSDCQGVILRAGGVGYSGGVFTDPDFAWAYNLLREHTSLPIGAYFLFQPQGTADVHYEHFNALVEGLDLKLGHYWDVELNAKTIGPRVFRDRLWKAINDGPQDAGIYTRGYFWNDHVNKDGKIGQEWQGIPLWIARYSTWAAHPWDNDTASKLRPRPWVDWDIWQWSADGNGMGSYYGIQSEAADRNRHKIDSIVVPPPPQQLPPPPISGTRMVQILGGSVEVRI